METLTLNLPEALSRNLRAEAQQAGVSLEDLVLFALTRLSTPAYTVQVVSEEERHRQETLRAALRQSLGPPATIEEARRFLETRELVEPELDLDPVAVARLRASLWQGEPVEEKHNEPLQHVDSMVG